METCWKVILDYSVPCFMASPPPSPDCTGAPDCSDLGRGPCSLDTPEQTCSSCLPGHVGEQGDGNTQCIRTKPFIQLQKEFYLYACFCLPLSSTFSFCLPAVCSGAPNCAALNRYPCSEVPNTCGRCFPRHLGVEGFSNESCFGMSCCTIRPGPLGQSSNSFSYCFKS